MSEINIDLPEINRKKEKLEKVKQELKSEFIGIDYIIDQLIDYIAIWYLMPEVLHRPIIINLWGMTGVGKTDLVRKLVSKIEFQERFVEIELSNSHSGRNIGSSVASILEDNLVMDKKPAIVLFDEIQRFYTIDSEGKPIKNTNFQDFWELLSDGRLARKDIKEEIDNYITTYKHHSKLARKRMMSKNFLLTKTDDDDDEEEEEKVGIWEAQSLKSTFDLNDDVEVIAEMTKAELLIVLQERKEQKKIYEPIDYSKSLIIISGNLDEAYSMAGAISETDLEADVFRSYTEKISIVNIKNALSRKFKPEQVARFGNIHLIYKSLRRQDFNDLIQSEINKIIAKNKKIFNIDVQIHPHVKTLVYQNGVFPVQGVRPVFSSITDIIESNLSKFVFKALMSGQKNVSIDYDFEKKILIAQIGANDCIEIPYIGKIDSIREGNMPDIIANLSVHEAGHAVAYSVLFGLLPLGLKSKVASTYAGGFSFWHQIHGTRQNIKNQIITLLAGGIAEEIIFGKPNQSISQAGDLEMATLFASEYVRKYGLEDSFRASYTAPGIGSLDFVSTDSLVDYMIKQFGKETKELLETHFGFLLKIAKALEIKGYLNAKSINQIAIEFGFDLQEKEDAFLVIPPYKSTIESFDSAKY